MSRQFSLHQTKWSYRKFKGKLTRAATKQRYSFRGWGWQLCSLRRLPPWAGQPISLYHGFAPRMQQVKGIVQFSSKLHWNQCEMPRVNHRFVSGGDPEDANHPHSSQVSTEKGNQMAMEFPSAGSEWVSGKQALNRHLPSFKHRLC